MEILQIWIKNCVEQGLWIRDTSSISRIYPIYPSKKLGIHPISQALSLFLDKIQCVFKRTKPSFKDKWNETVQFSVTRRKQLNSFKKKQFNFFCWQKQKPDIVATLKCPRHRIQPSAPIFIWNWNKVINNSVLMMGIKTCNSFPFSGHCV